MRKLNIMFIAAAIAGLFSCSKVEDISPVKQGPPISFDQVTTRVEMNDMDDINTNGFGVWAIMSPKTQYTPTALLSNEKVYLDSGNWTYVNTQFWANNSDFYFVAAYPYNDATPPLTERSQEENGVTYKYYTIDNVVTSNQANVTDILVATNYTDTSSGSFNGSNPVSFTFGHIFTKVSFKIKQNFDKDPENDYFVKSITIEGIKDNATFGVLPDNGTVDSGWSLIGATKTSFSKTYGETQKLRGEGANKVVILEPLSDLFLIPQEIEEGVVKVGIKYDYRLKGDPEDGSKDEPKSIEITLPATNLWQPGRALSYTIALAAQSEIKLSAPTIEPWGTPQTGGTIIIK